MRKKLFTGIFGLAVFSMMFISFNNNQEVVSSINQNEVMYDSEIAIGCKGLCHQGDPDTASQVIAYEESKINDVLAKY